MSISIMGKTGYTCIRHILCSVNLFFWVLGCCILSIGIWLHISYETYARILPSYHVLSADNLAIASGVVMLLIGFFGCCGSWFQNKCLLGLYLAVIVIIMLLEITGGSLGFVFRRQIRETLKDELTDGIKEKYNVTNSNGLVSTWDYIQTSFNCCGVDNYTDWYNIKAWPESNFVPESCCIPLDGDELPASSSQMCGRDPTKELHRYKVNGCYMKIRHWLLEHLHIVGLTCIGFAFIQFFAIVSTLLVICTMDYKKRFRPMNSNYRPTYNRVPTL